jgi:hypothetical protein
MVLSITFTVCFGVLASGATIAVISLVRPEADVSNWIARVTGILNTMIGLLAGFLAGRTDREVHRSEPAVTPDPQT